MTQARNLKNGSHAPCVTIMVCSFSNMHEKSMEGWKGNCNIKSRNPGFQALTDAFAAHRQCARDNDALASEEGTSVCTCGKLHAASSLPPVICQANTFH